MPMEQTPLGQAVAAVLRQPVIDIAIDRHGTAVTIADVPELLLDFHKATSEALILIADALDNRNQLGG